MWGQPLDPRPQAASWVYVRVRMRERACACAWGVHVHVHWHAHHDVCQCVFVVLLWWLLWVASERHRIAGRPPPSHAPPPRTHEPGPLPTLLRLWRTVVMLVGEGPLHSWAGGGGGPSHRGRCLCYVFAWLVNSTWQGWLAFARVEAVVALCCPPAISQP